MVPASVLMVTAVMWMTATCVLLDKQKEPQDSWQCYRVGEVSSDYLDRALRTLRENADLFASQPNWWRTDVGFIRDDSGEETMEIGVVVSVRRKVWQLPWQDRLPDCIGRVPIEVRVEQERVPTKEDDGDIVYIEDMVSGLDMSTGRVHNESGPKPRLRLVSDAWIECPGGDDPKASIDYVRDKYADLFSRRPSMGVVSLKVDVLKDELGIETRQEGIIVNVHDTSMPQSDLPPEDRVPDCLDGFPAKVKPPYKVKQELAGGGA